MTASKDMSRPTSQHRLSVGSNASSLPLRTSYGRSHSHTVSLGSVGGSHRINRRKSSNFSPALHAAAIGAAAIDVSASPAAHRRSSTTKAALSALNDGTTACPSSLPHHASMPDGGSAITDGPALASFQGVDGTSARMRRASDGTRLSKKEKAANGDLKCETCGKAYKHGSCLSKHLWEHTPQWQYTSKLLISKHQQVQLLEAASVLVGMNQDGPAMHVDSDNNSSSSPAASGSSDRDEDVSSAETTPPPQSDHHHSYRDNSKRHSNNSSAGAHSRSYQSLFSTSAGSAPQYQHHRHWSSSSNAVPRPLTAHAPSSFVPDDIYRDEDPQDLAAAVGLLSCSYGGTPKSGPVGFPASMGGDDDVPPVPPLPEKYANSASTSAFAGFRGQDVVMDEDQEDEEEDEHDHSDDDDIHEQHHHRHQPSRDDYEGVFGKMDA